MTVHVQQMTERSAPNWKRKTVTLCKEDSDKSDEMKEGVFLSFHCRRKCTVKVAKGDSQVTGELGRMCRAERGELKPEGNRGGAGRALALRFVSVFSSGTSQRFQTKSGMLNYFSHC